MTKSKVSKEEFPDASNGLDNGLGLQNEVFKLDFSEVVDFNIAPGLYPAKIIMVEHGNSKAGKPMFTWNLLVTGGDNKGSKQKFYTSLSGPALFKLKETLKNLKYKMVDNKSSVDLVSFMDKACIIKVVEDKDDPARTNVDSILAPDAQATKLASADKINI